MKIITELRDGLKSSFRKESVFIISVFLGLIAGTIVLVEKIIVL